MATRTISNAGGNYNAVGTWVEGAIPTSADDVVATPTSGNLTVTDARSALSLNFTNYTGTFTINSGVTLSVYGNITFVAGMTLVAVSTSSIIQIFANCTLTSAGKTWGGQLSFSGSRTLTLADDARVKYLNCPNAAITNTINGFSLYVENWDTQNIAIWTGTVNLILSPAITGTVTGIGIGGQLTFTNPIQINAVGALTLTGPLGFGCSLTYVAGTVLASTSTPVFYGAAKTLNLTSAVKFGTITLQGSYTLTGELWSLGSCTFSGSSVYNGGSIYVGGNYGSVNNTNPSGTTVIRLNGTGNISTPNYPNSTLRNPLIVDTAGAYTFTTDVIIGGNFTHVAGTINPNGKTLYLGNTLTLDCAGVNWYNVSTSSFWSATPTYTLNSALNVSNELTLINMTTIFAGTAGFNVAKLLLKTTTTTRTLTLKDGVTYNVTNRFEVEATSNPWTITSSSATIKANLVLAHGAEQLVKNCNATRIDSSGGLTIYTSIARTLTDIINWGLGEGSWWPLLRKF